MALVARAARGALIPARLKVDRNLASFAARAHDGSLRVCLINKDARGARVRIDPGRRFAAASAMRLPAPSPEAVTGLTPGGASIDAFRPLAQAPPEMLPF